MYISYNIHIKAGDGMKVDRLDSSDDRDDRDGILSFNFKGTRKDLTFTLNELKKYADFDANNDNNSNNNNRIQSRLMNVDKEKHLFLFNSNSPQPYSRTPSYISDWLSGDTKTLNHLHPDIYFSTATITDQFNLGGQVNYNDSQKSDKTIKTSCCGFFGEEVKTSSRVEIIHDDSEESHDVTSSSKHNADSNTTTTTTTSDHDAINGHNNYGDSKYHAGNNNEYGFCGFLCIEPSFEGEQN